MVSYFYLHLCLITVISVFLCFLYVPVTILNERKKKVCGKFHYLVDAETFEASHVI